MTSRSNIFFAVSVTPVLDVLAFGNVPPRRKHIADMIFFRTQPLEKGTKSMLLVVRIWPCAHHHFQLQHPWLPPLGAHQEVHCASNHWDRTRRPKWWHPWKIGSSRVCSPGFVGDLDELQVSWVVNTTFLGGQWRFLLDSIELIWPQFNWDWSTCWFAGLVVSDFDNNAIHWSDQIAKWRHQAIPSMLHFSHDVDIQRSSLHIRWVSCTKERFVQLVWL